MKKEDYKLISEISNSYFLLIDFVNDLDILKSQRKLEECVYQKNAGRFGQNRKVVQILPR